MNHIQHNVSLLAYNTFGIDVKANKLAVCHTVKEIQEAIELAHAEKLPILVIGGGSNMVFTGDYDGMIIQALFTDLSIVKEDNDSCWIEAGSGIEWDHFVAYTVERQLGGLENLSHIPGHVGASPIQNIGAYGIEAKDSIEKVNGIYLKDGQVFSFTNEECKFGYRDSIFKKTLKNKVIVTSVLYKLTKSPELNISYGSVKDEVEKQGELSLENIRKAIISIRESKLPEPSEIGNAGSFFKNPVIEKSIYQEIEKRYPQAPFYPIDETHVKVPAGWLIEQCGWKGKTMGHVGVHHKQALVLINKGGAKGDEVVNLSAQIIQDIKQKFNITLEREVNLI